MNNIEVIELPVTKNENFCSLVKDVGAGLGIEVQLMDIAAAHRVSSFRGDREPAIVVQFSSQMVKAQWIIMSQQKGNLTAREVNKQFPAKSVYVNDHLSPENKQFLTKLKKKGREVGYSFVWCRDGKFYVKRSKGDQIKRVNTYAELENLK